MLIFCKRLQWIMALQTGQFCSIGRWYKINTTYYLDDVHCQAITGYFEGDFQTRGNLTAPKYPIQFQLNASVYDGQHIQAFIDKWGKLSGNPESFEQAYHQNGEYG
jgi:hypothetical protein